MRLMASSRTLKPMRGGLNPEIDDANAELK
jgi:hypothetical protein